MIYTHTIGRIGAKDCRVITGTHGTFMAVEIAVDDYSKGKQITTWVRVKSSRENHIRLAEYITKGRMVLVEGTLKMCIRDRPTYGLMPLAKTLELGNYGGFVLSYNGCQIDVYKRQGRNGVSS